VALVHLKDVEVSYGALKALDGISCTITGGAIGLLGPNGAGKSTLLKAMLGFLRAEKGRIEMFGKPMPEHALEARQKLGYMPEREVVSPKISAVSFLTYCGRLFGMSRVDAMERAHEVLNYVGMGDNRYRKMETYSTGMLQRVKFAQALIHDPKLLLLDEPTNGLDPEGRVEMLELVRELAHKRRVTVILSSHLLPDVAHVCDWLLVINKGKVVRNGSLDELTAVRDGLFEVRVHENQPAYVDALINFGFRCTPQQDGNLLVSQPNGASPTVLFEIAQAQQTHIRHFRPVRHSLEDAFLDAVGRDAEPIE
jgi:ABC-2 type transport system ATP-binding protein